MKPVIIIGAGPVGLTMALALRHHGIPFVLVEEDKGFSSDTKAGTVLTRTIEAFRRYGVAENVLAHALRVDEIGEVDRATNRRKPSVNLDVLREESRFPFVLNIPQHHLEPLLAEGLEPGPGREVRLNSRFENFTETADGIRVQLATPDGPAEVEGSWLIACDGGRSTVRGLLDVPVEGHTLDVQYRLVDIRADLDRSNPRDYPYLAYFSDPEEWMVLVRQPHCWRFLFPLKPDAGNATPEEMEAKVRRFIGDVDRIEVLNTITYRVHHRVASEWRRGRVFLAGDAAHLITPMWALGMNTGVLDALNLPWRLAWVMRGWADPALLDGYPREQRPLAVHGSGEMAEAARAAMGNAAGADTLPAQDPWAFAMTRSLLGVRLDADGTSGWSIVNRGLAPLRVGERFPDAQLQDGMGRAIRAHDLCDAGFVALHFTDARRGFDLDVPARPGLMHRIVSRWDAPLDGGLRAQSLLDVGDRLRQRLGLAGDATILLRPDDHVAAILPLSARAALEHHDAILAGRIPG